MPCQSTKSGYSWETRGDLGRTRAALGSSSTQHNLLHFPTTPSQQAPRGATRSSEAWQSQQRPRRARPELQAPHHSAPTTAPHQGTGCLPLLPSGSLQTDGQGRKIRGYISLKYVKFPSSFSWEMCFKPRTAQHFAVSPALELW